MDIYCIKCDTHVGLIRDAKLRKGIVFLCNTCNQTRIKAEQNHEDTTDNNTLNIKANSEEELGEAIRRELFGGGNPFNR